MKTERSNMNPTLAMRTCSIIGKLQSLHGRINGIKELCRVRRDDITLAIIEREADLLRIRVNLDCCEIFTYPERATASQCRIEQYSRRILELLDRASRRLSQIRRNGFENAVFVRFA